MRSFFLEKRHLLKNKCNKFEKKTVFFNLSFNGKRKTTSFKYLKIEDLFVFSYNYFGRFNYNLKNLKTFRSKI